MAVQNPTSNYNWTLPTPGASVGVWGQMLNEILGDDATGIDAVLASMLPKAGGTITGNLTVQGDANAGSLQIGGTTVISNTRRLQQVTFSAGLIDSGTLRVESVPDLDASKITSGTFAAARIPGLDASKITSGTFAAARIPGLDASKITSGTFGVARGGTGRATLTSNALLAGNGTSAVNLISPGGDKGYLYTGGSAWGYRKITISTNLPSGTPQDGDLWFRY